VEEYFCPRHHLRKLSEKYGVGFLVILSFPYKDRGEGKLARGPNGPMWCGQAIMPRHMVYHGLVTPSWIQSAQSLYFDEKLSWYFHPN
jgi:hypothetical protein